MDVHAARGDERMLRRIIALLVSLAALAERAAPRSLPVRWLVLWILRRAETVLEDFVLDETGAPPPTLVGIAPAGNDPDDAFALAWRFRALAAALAVLLPPAYPFGRRSARRGFARGHVAPAAARFPGGCARKPYDTS